MRVQIAPGGGLHHDRCGRGDHGSGMVARAQVERARAPVLVLAKRHAAVLVIVGVHHITMLGRMHRQLDELAQPGPHGQGQEEGDQPSRHALSLGEPRVGVKPANESQLTPSRDRLSVDEVTRLLISLLLLVGVTPGAGELIEVMVGAGHVASAGGDSEQDEHGCTPLMHTCSCHVAGHGALTAATQVDAHDLAQVAIAAPCVHDLHQRPAAPPALRPPIA